MEKLDYSKLIDCAAIKLSGLVWTGKRHCNIFKQIMQAYEISNLGHTINVHEGIQGFVIMDNTFVDRKTAYKYVLETKQELKGDLPLNGYDELYSEHLY